MHIKTSDLTDIALDWAVAKARRALQPTGNVKLVDGKYLLLTVGGDPDHEGTRVHFSPSTDQAQGGDIIDDEGITTLRCEDDYVVDGRGFTTSKRIPVWGATTDQHRTHSSYEGEHYPDQYEIAESEVIHGPTRLIAAMRCYVASTLGDVVDVPDALVR